MQELEKILEEMRQIKDGNRKENLYAKYPPNDKDQEVLNAYSQGYEDGTDNFYNAIVEMIHNHMNDGWIPVEERLPEVTEEDIIPVEVTTMGGLRTVGCYFEYMNEWYALDGDSKLDVIAWKEPSEPYQPERRDNHDGK